MLKRPHAFDDIKGHPNVNEFFRTHIENGTLPQQIIISGEEGLGKTSFADVIAVSLIYGLEDSSEKQKAIKEVIDNNKSTENIKKYKMSVEGGKDAAKEVLAEFNLSMTPKHKKVLILDECHGMSDAAQDVFLSDTEYLPTGLYIIMLTTETSKLRQTLLSRFFPITLKRLKQADMLFLLRKEVEEKNIKVQGGDATLSLIANWADNKPRLAMKLLDGFADGSAVSSNAIKEFIGYLEVDDVLPIVTALGDSITFGLSYISEMTPNDSITDILIEMLKIKMGQPSYKLQLSEATKIREALVNVSQEALVTMVCSLSANPRVTRQTLTHAFLEAHPSRARLDSVPSGEILNDELIQKAAITPPEVQRKAVQAPSFADLLRNSKVVK